MTTDSTIWHEHWPRWDQVNLTTVCWCGRPDCQLWRREVDA